MDQDGRIYESHSAALKMMESSGYNVEAIEGLKKADKNLKRMPKKLKEKSYFSLKGAASVGLPDTGLDRRGRRERLEKKRMDIWTLANMNHKMISVADGKEEEEEVAVYGEQDEERAQIDEMERPEEGDKTKTANLMEEEGSGIADTIEGESIRGESPVDEISKDTEEMQVEISEDKVEVEEKDASKDQIEVKRCDLRLDPPEEDGKVDVMEEVEVKEGGEGKTRGVVEDIKMADEVEDGGSSKSSMVGGKHFPEQKNIFDDIDDLNTLNTLDELLVGSGLNI